ncbi:alpha-L-arabinofuranosidase [bacterium]|nr:MAG: alpha-L-arabinofuranosidase [bacterium]
MSTKILVIALAGALMVPAFAQNQPNRLSIDLEKPGAKVSPLLYGIFFEEINRAGEGGIYAEMVQNRSFEDSAEVPAAWLATNATVSLDKSNPLNANNPTSLRVEAQAGGSVANLGFIGGGPRWNMREWNDVYLPKQPSEIAVAAGKTYDVSLYARAQVPVELTVSLQGKDGKTLASQKVTGVGNGWKQFAVSLKSGATDANARLVVSSPKAATFWLDMVSLFPRDTWKGRKNGLRPDLLDKLAAMKPAFVRFPGGCYVEGFKIENRVQWKKTIGDVAERPGHLNANWGYYSSDGLGLYEYFQMCEDLGAEPLYVINVGMGHDVGGMYAVPIGEMGPFVQDALDVIEYANGPVTSKWGALRAKAGHPKPFNLKYMEIGNENGGREYDERYALFHDAIKAKYPNMELIANEITPSRTNDIFDPHMYSNYAAFLTDSTRFDKQDRNGPKVYFGEYAVTEGADGGNLQAALGEAAFMTGLERNGDVVKMSSYAPLLCRPTWRGWNPNALLFDQSRVYGTPSYYVQAMFAANRADQILPVQMQIAAPPALPIEGKIGVGTWGGQAEFKDIKVTKGDQTLFQSDFSQNANGWKLARGQWTTENGALKQTSDENGTLAMVGESNWRDYTLTLKARKLSGREGFLITFGARTEGEKSWWNLGGWGNSQNGVESIGLDGPRTPATIESNRWYDIKIELQGTNANFYLDGQLVQSLTRAPLPAFAAVAGRDQKTGETILKFVNASSEPRTINLDLNGAKAGKINGRAWVMTSANERDENSFDAPTRITPREEAFSANAPDFTRTFPANSVSVLRWK